MEAAASAAEIFCAEVFEWTRFHGDARFDFLEAIIGCVVGMVLMLSLRSDDKMVVVVMLLLLAYMKLTRSDAVINSFSPEEMRNRYDSTPQNQLELELELIQTQMTQKPMLQAEVEMRVRCANKASAE